jgi:hypothetical protein
MERATTVRFCRGFLRDRARVRHRTPRAGTQKLRPFRAEPRQALLVPDINTRSAQTGHYQSHHRNGDAPRQT